MFKKILFILSFSSLVFFLFNACKEIGVPIDFTPVSKNRSDTDYLASVDVPQQKVVLLEDFTGVRCVNCPDAHDVARQIVADNLGRVIVIAIHNGGPLSHPYSNSKENYETPEGYEIDNLLGTATSHPTGDVDRKKYPSESAILIDYHTWTTYVNEELLKSTPVNIFLKSNLDSVNRKLNTTVELHYTDTSSIDHFLSVMIREDGIIDPQLTSVGVQDDYPHEFILRKMLTPVSGTLLNVSKEPGRLVKRTFTLDMIPAQWNLDNCKIIAFVHLGGDVHDVLQSAVIPFK